VHNVSKKDIEKILRRNKAILKKYKVNKVGIFGSFAIGKTKKKSDVDLLVEFEDVIDLFDFVHLTDEIQKVLKVKVDLSTPDAIKPYIKPVILREVEWIEGL
jgi:predicted nucleotidyltransferase